MNEAVSHGAHRAPDEVPTWAAWGAMLFLGLFAACRDRPLPWGLLGWLGLLGAAICLAYGVFHAGSGVRHLFGLNRVRRPAAGWMVAAILLGVALSVAYRAYAGLALWPSALGWFAALAAAVGAVEELVYRGFAQTGLRRGGRFSAVVFAAAGHAAYKGLLFTWRPGVSSPDLGFLVVATFLVGLLVGGLREASGSVWPPVLAHAAFDIVLYGALATAPWWVWG